MEMEEERGNGSCKGIVWEGVEHNRNKRPTELAYGGEG